MRLKQKAHAALRTSLLLAGLSVGAQGGFAQDAVDYEAIGKNLDAFSVVLRDSLGLGGRSGSFNPFASMSSAYYLAGQGAVIELNSPLARSRATIGMPSLGATLQQLAEDFAGDNSPPGGNRRQYMQELRDSMTLSMQAESAPEKYREIMRKVADVDFPTEVDKAIRSARDSLRSLRGSQEIDQETLREIDAQMDSLRDELLGNVDALQSMRADMSASLRETLEEHDDQLQQWQESLDSLLARVAPLRDSAMEKATQLGELRDAELAKREAQWQTELAEFESTLNQSVCEYGVLLRELPTDEKLSLILKGLGDKGRGASEDRIVVYNKADILRCQSGAITALQLQQSAQSYSF